MKIMSREEFLAIEHEVVYSNYEPIVFGELLLKVSQYSDNYWVMCGIADSISDTPYYNEKALLLNPEAVGQSISFDFEKTMKDSSRSDRDMYAVWERDDVIQLINRLRRVVDSMPNPDRELRKVEIASLSGVLEVKDEVREFDLTQYPNLPPYQLRVIEEYKQVATDCLKLSEFIKSEVFYTVYKEERSRLISQRSLMRQYAGVLLERIGAFLATYSNYC